MNILLSRITESRVGRWASGSIRNKLLMAMTIAGVLPLLIVGIAINQAATTSLRQQSFDSLNAVKSAKSERLADYF